MIFLGNEPIDLQLTLLDSAQCFSWEKQNEGFRAVLGETLVRLDRDESGIWAEGSDAASLRRYLDLDRDYEALYAQYKHIPPFRRAYECFPGLRVLKEDPWDALLWGILSANNNVGRIRKLRFALAEHFGREISEGCFANPTPRVLASASEAELRALGVGYRAPYIIGSARMICEGFPLYTLRELPYEDALSRMLRLPGVGDKVANCVLLFGCGFDCAFPVDVWVGRLLQQHFGIACKNRLTMRKIALEELGAQAGLLQQFMFHAQRMGVLL